MTNEDRLKHLCLFHEKSYGIVNELPWDDFLQLYQIFKCCNPDYSIQCCVEESDGLELNQKYNRFAGRHIGFNRYIDGDWEEIY